MKSETKKGLLLGLSAAIFWGISGPLGQFIFQQRGINLEWLITMRLLCSGVGLLFLANRTKNNIFEIWHNKKDAIQLLVFSIFGIVAVQYTYFAAIKHSNAATATVLQYVAPLFIAIYLALKYRKLPSKIELLALFLAVVGTFLLVTGGNMDSLSISGLAFMLGIASAITLAFYTLQPKALLEKYNAASVVGWGMLIGGISFSFIKAPWVIVGVWDLKALLSVTFIIVFATLIAFFAYLTAVKMIGGQKTSLIACAEPLVAVILSVIWLNTPFYIYEWIGSICIVSTVYLLTRNEKK